ncbi:hypothetical protein EVC24_153 [Rhizobium phage RHph_I4]|nr:hypothetical protein EVC24_153 [Rhizobium phage RHph_I4]
MSERYLFSFGMEIGTYTPRGGECYASSFEEAAQQAKEFYKLHPAPTYPVVMAEGDPTAILITSGFTAAVFNYDTLERQI